MNHKALPRPRIFPMASLLTRWRLGTAPALRHGEARLKLLTSTCRPSCGPPTPG